MSTAKGRRSEAGSPCPALDEIQGIAEAIDGATDQLPSAALTEEDLDLAFEWLLRESGDYLRTTMLWGLGAYTPEHVGDSNASRLMTSQMMINKVIEDIGEDAGRAADELVSGTLRPIQEAPHMEPDLVWSIARAYWHEIVHRGMEIGRVDAYWIKGLKEFSYDEVLVFVQHIWLAFKHYTGLDFMVPEQSKTIKTWLSLSPKLTQRELSPDSLHSGDTPEERRDRLQHYIDHGGPSRKFTEGGPMLGEGLAMVMGNWEYDARDD